MVCICVFVEEFIDELELLMLVEGLLGVGLVGKIVVDYLVLEFDMIYYVDVFCEGVLKVVVYMEDDLVLYLLVRFYVDVEWDLFVF